MPTYQYACTVCDHSFEQFQSFSEDSLSTCPECQGRLRKVFNAVGVVFKGSGFYRTDSRSDASAGSTATAGASGSGSSASSTTSDTKPSGDGGTSKPAAPAPAKSESAA